MIRCAALVSLLLVARTVCARSKRDRADRELDGYGAHGSTNATVEADEDEIDTMPVPIGTGSLQASGSLDAYVFEPAMPRNRDSKKRKAFVTTLAAIEEEDECLSECGGKPLSKRRTLKPTWNSGKSRNERVQLKLFASTANAVTSDTSILPFTLKQLGGIAESSADATQHFSYKPPGLVGIAAASTSELVNDAEFHSFFSSLKPPGREIMGVQGLMAYESMLDEHENCRLMRAAIINSNEDAICALAFSGHYTLSESDFLIAAMTRGLLVNRRFVNHFCKSPVFGSTMREHWTGLNMEDVTDAFVPCHSLAELAATQLLYPLFNLPRVPITADNKKVLKLLAELASAQGIKIHALTLFYYLTLSGEFESMRLLYNLGVVTDDTLTDVIMFLLKRQDSRPDLLAAFLAEFAPEIRNVVAAMGPENETEFTNQVLVESLKRSDAPTNNYALAQAIVSAGVCDSVAVVRLALHSFIDPAAFTSLLQGASPVAVIHAPYLFRDAFQESFHFARLMGLLAHNPILNVIADALAEHSLKVLLLSLSAPDSPGYIFSLRIFTNLSSQREFVQRVAHMLFKPREGDGVVPWDAVAAALSQIPTYAALRDSIASSGNDEDSIAAALSRLSLDRTPQL